MIKQFTDFPGNVVAFACQGRVTKADYDAVLVPAVTNALRTHNKLRLLLRNQREISLSSTPAAAWEDFKVGMQEFHAMGPHCLRHRRRMDQAHLPIFSVSSCPRRRKSFR